MTALLPLSRPTTKVVVRCPRTIAWRWALISPLPFTCTIPAYQSAPSNLFLHPRA
ncbi:hypothetical protein BCR43DRAFT_491570 [Syncephalastrum racemosum]|uniref:Uncharacterized protein n=1 Tax=Syncephalastrum racemosum TaxID=13706 RepID=A0A1X2HC42_SYNRA|nr:hypothetical protein BCR43DRAFT_491570 [Syncephalastrum racemosum]